MIPVETWSRARESAAEWEAQRGKRFRKSGRNFSDDKYTRWSDIFSELWSRACALVTATGRGGHAIYIHIGEGTRGPCGVYDYYDCYVFETMRDRRRRYVSPAVYRSLRRRTYIIRERSDSRGRTHAPPPRPPRSGKHSHGPFMRGTRTTATVTTTRRRRRRRRRQQRAFSREAETILLLLFRFTTRSGR